MLSSGVDEECSICLDSLSNPVITRCAHVFCFHCIVNAISTDGFDSKCPLCRAPVNENDLIKVPERKKAEKGKEETGASAEWKSSAKVGTKTKS